MLFEFFLASSFTSSQLLTPKLQFVERIHPNFNDLMICFSQVEKEYDRIHEDTAGYKNLNRKYGLFSRQKSENIYWKILEDVRIYVHIMIFFHFNRAYLRYKTSNPRWRCATFRRNILWNTALTGFKKCRCHFYILYFGTKNIISGLFWDKSPVLVSIHILL